MVHHLIQIHHSYLGEFHHQYHLLTQPISPLHNTLSYPLLLPLRVPFVSPSEGAGDQPYRHLSEFHRFPVVLAVRLLSLYQSASESILSFCREAVYRANRPCRTPSPAFFPEAAAKYTPNPRPESGLLP